MDKTVDDLKQSLLQLKQAHLDFASKTSGTQPVSDKQALVMRLMMGVEQHFGIYSSAQVEKKLLRIFDSMNDALLRAWVSELEKLPGDHPEWRSLVENLTVHETYFNRDKPTLQVLQDVILPDLIDDKIKKGDKRLKIWSAGCATGEEAYNLAMLLLLAMAKLGEAAVLADGDIKAHQDWRIDILGSDVSSQVLRIAESATYADFDMGPFRDASFEQQRFFDALGAQFQSENTAYYRVKPFVKRWVRFQYHNLLSAKPPEGDFDLVLCRNVLIYFKEDAKFKVQSVLSQSLKAGGVLILGGADRLLHPECFDRRFDQGVAWHVKRPDS